MSRGITPAVAAALSDAVVRPVLFFEGVFTSGVLRLWTGLGTTTWDGKSWIGAGQFLGISPIEETSDVVASGFVMNISGVPLAYVSLCIADAQQGLAGRVWLGFLTEAGAVIAEPSMATAGRLDVPTLSDDADTCTISISYESKLIDLTRPREWRYTHESQLALYPGDVGFWYQALIQDAEVVWGAPGVPLRQ